MKRGMIKRSIFALVVFTFLLSGVFAALPDSGKCIVNTRAECTGNYHIVMGLSSPTSAHGEVAPGAYNNVLCCAFGTGTTTCSGLNTVIKLSAPSNAHAEIANGTAYSTRVCYEDLSCTSTTSSTCPENNPIQMLSLTSTTNAHIGAFADYPVKICCSSAIAQMASCTINSALWVIPSGDVIEGQNVEMLVTGSSSADCNDALVVFDVRGGDYNSIIQPMSVPFNGNTARGVWTAQHQAGFLGIGDVSYTFNASIFMNPGASRLSSNTLTVKENHIVVNVCSDYTVPGQCNSDVANVADDSSPSTDIDCSSESTLCGCVWNTAQTRCEFSYTRIDEPLKCDKGETKCYDTQTETSYCYPGNTCPSGDTPSCNSDGICDTEEGCTCSDCNGRTDTCSGGLTCSGGSCGGTTTTGNVTCTEDEDCEMGQNCILGICHMPIHTCEDVTCPAGQYCRDGTCGVNQTGTNGSVTCIGDGDCASGNECIAGICFNPVDSCTGVSCPSPSVCISGTCVNNNGSLVTDGCDYGYTLCNAVGLFFCYPGNTCPSGETAGNNNGVCEFGFDGCSSSDCEDSDRDTCKQGLYCINERCSSVLPLANLNLSNCRITQTIEKDCNTEPTGYRTITWSGVWMGNITSGAAYSRCIAGGTDNVPCPAEIQLPFFDYLQMIITLVVIAGIYVSLVLKSKIKKKK